MPHYRGGGLVRRKKKVGAPKRASQSDRPAHAGAFAVGGARRTADEGRRSPPAQWLCVGAHRLPDHRVLGALWAAAGPPPLVGLVASSWPVSRVMARQCVRRWFMFRKYIRGGTSCIYSFLMSGGSRSLGMNRRCHVIRVKFQTCSACDVEFTVFTHSAVADGSGWPGGEEESGGVARCWEGSAPGREDSRLVVGGKWLGRTGCCFPVLGMSSRSWSRRSWWVETSSAPWPPALTFSTRWSRDAPPRAPFLLGCASIGHRQHVPSVTLVACWPPPCACALGETPAAYTQGRLITLHTGGGVPLPPAMAPWSPWAARA